MGFLATISHVQAARCDWVSRLRPWKLLATLACRVHVSFAGLGEAGEKDRLT